MKRLLKKIHTLLFTVDLMWLMRFVHKRGIQRMGHFKTKLSGRLDVDVNIDGTSIILSTLTPYHHSIATSIAEGIYETAPMRSWLQQISGKKQIYDLGGFNGVYGFVAALRAPDSQIVIYEPDATNIKEIKRSIELNHLSNCHVEAAAISEHSGTVYFTQGASTGEHISDEKNGIAVTAYALKDLPHADLLKFDIEGAEAMALRGMDYKSTIVLEAHKELLPNFGDSYDSIMQLIKEKGYQIRSIDNDDPDHPHILLLP